VLASSLTATKEIVLPLPGENLQEGQFICWIILEDGAYPLVSPVNGIVLRLNDALLSNPHLLCSHPLSEGWLFESESRTINSKNWMTPEEADKKYQESMTHLYQLLNSKLDVKHTDIGPTMQDGGHKISDIARLLGGRKYLEVLVKVFPQKTH
jgi:glycine cleavage system H lipoate-binding protein